MEEANDKSDVIDVQPGAQTNGRGLHKKKTSSQDNRVHCATFFERTVAWAQAVRNAVRRSVQKVSLGVLIFFLRLLESSVIVGATRVNLETCIELVRCSSCLAGNVQRTSTLLVSEKRRLKRAAASLKHQRQEPERETRLKWTVSFSCTMNGMSEQTDVRGLNSPVFATIEIDPPNNSARQAKRGRSKERGKSASSDSSATRGLMNLVNDSPWTIQGYKLSGVEKEVQDSRLPQDSRRGSCASAEEQSPARSPSPYQRSRVQDKSIGFCSKGWCEYKQIKGRGQRTRSSRSTRSRRSSTRGSNSRTTRRDRRSHEAAGTGGRGQRHA